MKKIVPICAAVGAAAMMLSISTSAVAMGGPSAGPNVKEEPAHPYLTEYRWGETKPAVELKINSVMGYQAFPISVEQAFTH